MSKGVISSKDKTSNDGNDGNDVESVQYWKKQAEYWKQRSKNITDMSADLDRWSSLICCCHCPNVIVWGESLDLGRYYGWKQIDLDCEEKGCYPDIYLCDDCIDDEILPEDYCEHHQQKLRKKRSKTED